jgi:hypothetical protein
LFKKEKFLFLKNISKRQMYLFFFFIPFFLSLNLRNAAPRVIATTTTTQLYIKQNEETEGKKVFLTNIT